MLEFIKDVQHFEDVKSKEEFFMLMFYSNSSQKVLKRLK